MLITYKQPTIAVAGSEPGLLIGYPFNRNKIGELMNVSGDLNLSLVNPLNGTEINAPFEGSVTRYTHGKVKAEDSAITAWARRAFGGVETLSDAVFGKAIEIEDEIVFENDTLKAVYQGVLGNDKAANKGTFKNHENLGIIAALTPNNFRYGFFLKDAGNTRVNAAEITWSFRDSPDVIKAGAVAASSARGAAEAGGVGLILGLGFALWVVSKKGK